MRYGSCHTVHGAGFCRTSETDPWALQSAVLSETDPLLQVRERFALTRTVRRAGLLLRELYKGCPEMQIRQRANLLRRQTYLPYNVAMQRARDEMKPKAPPPAQPASPAVDNCWSRDRTAPSSLSADTGTPVSYARVAARGGTANWDLFRSLPGTAEINVGNADLDEVNRRIGPSILEAAREAIPVTGGGL